ncbi:MULTISPECIES: site-specific DNA-methyltransferase [unclassified Janthinobacterium]|uniref:DNA-methyltransferase n=1 Tax=unclassified Janthinobacterium TaxID=2610881 RepID=UPI001E652D6F|nr:MULTISPECIES: site-specific DNA-methyltransferase [unclassified Janthinobacterium]MCC7645831.1 site-specific DNA-methyltransferase [Janthinobacterium sp. EB271-G4-3-1]MCC7693853.1 site-specific DNA-methyltransferase [Janthinobacterium sp. EB271-G4-3-2]
MTKLAEQPDWVNRVYCEDALAGLARIPDGSVDLILTDPPYNLGKDYGNASDQQSVADYLRWTEQWIDAALPKLKANGSLYIFLTWRYSPEIFVMLKQRMAMMNEIIWDRRVPSMGGSVRSFSSVHDTIGFFVKRKDYYFDLDAVRIAYDAATKKARSRSIFIGAKWLEVGYNPKDLWSVSRLHKEHPERADHPTQKPLEIIERMVKASCPPGGVVLDLFMGSGTTALAAKRCGRDFVGFELNPDYCAIIEQRLAALTQELAEPVTLAAPKAAKAAAKKPAAARKPAAVKKPPAVKKAPARKARSASVPEDVVI